MEHHTYAKSGSKKWSAEEKRLLVTKRIEAEDLFSKYSSKQAEPWKKFKDMTNIGDYSERALRKQWLNMVQRYRIHKANMQQTPLNQECINLLNEEWEFFGQIHAYMTQRTTDLHSYALKEPNMDPASNYNNIVAMRGLVNDHDCLSIKAVMQHQHQHRMPLLRLPKLDTAAEKAPVAASNKLYNSDSSSSSPQLQLQQQQLKVEMEEEPVVVVKSEPLSNVIYDDFNPLDDAFTDSLDSLATSSEPSDPVALEVSDLSETDSISASLLPDLDKTTSELGEPKIPIELDAGLKLGAAKAPKERKRRKRKALSEREKYYRHRRRYDHRMEMRLSGLCVVAGQLLERLVPDFNVTPLLTDICNNADDLKCNSSCDDEEDDDDDDDGEEDEDVEDQ